MRATALLLAFLLPLSAAAGPASRVLTEDPPLPGEPITGWEALGPQAPGALGLEEVVSLALASSPELRALEAEVDAARAELRSARALPNPHLELGLWELDEGRIDRASPDVELGLELSELLHGRLAAAAARPGVELARLQLEEARIRVAYEAKAAFFEHQAALASWGAALRGLDALAAGRDAQRAITAAGNAPTLDLINDEIAYEEARIRAAALERELVGTRERLARLLGRDPGDLAPFSTEATLALPEDLEGRAVSASLALRALDAAILSAERARTAARVEGLAPELGLRLASERQTEGWETRVGLELTAPLFAYGRGETLRASAEIDRLRAARQAAERELRASARELSARLASLRLSADHVEEVLLPARERALQETLLHYNAMQLGLDELLAAWRARVATEAQLAELRREAWTTEAALEALLLGARVEPPRAARPTENTQNRTGAH